MEFVNPLFLYGLIAISIPIIIHLFNFRKFRKVFFTNVNFLEELKQQTQKQSRLKYLLTLIMRILAVASLVFAFAQPYIPITQNDARREARNAVSIFIDNSFSMGLISPQGKLLDEGINKAREVAMAYTTTDLFQLLTNDFLGYHQRYVSRDEFLDMLNEVEISPSSRMIPDVYKRQNDLFSEQSKDNKVVCLISDFQQNISDFHRITSDTSVVVYLLPVEATEKSNLYIDSTWLEAPAYRIGQLARLNVRIQNTSKNDFEKIPLKLIINGQQRAISSFDIRPERDVTLNMPFTINQNGLHYGKLEIVDYPITYDDVLFFSFEVNEEIPILAINAGEPSVYLNSLFSKDSAFIFHNISENRLDYSTFNQYNLIILNGLNIIPSGLALELKRFMQGGGNVAVFPGEMVDLDSYRQLAQNLNVSLFREKLQVETRVSEINTLNRVYEDVFESVPENIDLPVVFSHYPISRQPSSMMESLLEMQNGNVFFGVEPVGNGMFYIFAAPLKADWSNFVRHAVFVPTLYKIALLSQGLGRLYYQVGENQQITLNTTLPGGDQVFRIRSIDKEFEIIPEIRSVFSQTEIFTQNHIKKAGHYNIVLNDEIVAGLAFNYNRKESELESYSKADLEKLILDHGLSNFKVIKPTERSLTDVMAELNTGVRLWKWFVIMALLFLFAEVVLLRFLK
jgi:hypothetical protein